MVKSMTGYGNDTFRHGETVMTVEIKSVNSRYLDITSKLPRALQEIEYKLKKMLQTYFTRGRIELNVTITGEPLQNKEVFIDWQLLDNYMQKLKEVKRKYHFDEELPISLIANQESLFIIREVNTSDESFHELLFSSVKRACVRVNETRKTEGDFLKEDVLGRVDDIQSKIGYIEEKKDDVQRMYRKRIEARILKHIDPSLELDQNILIQEIAMLAEKGDIQEEITRINSHLTHFKTMMTTGGEIGRKLDFIVQELHRETNTIGSKSIDAEISKNIVMMKSEIEKIKEQIQNIE